MKEFFTSRSEISSTEKLLDVIRGDASSAGKTSGPVQPERKRGKPGFFRIKTIPFRKKIVIGIDVGHNTLSMVKVEQIKDGRCRLLGYRSIPYPPGISPKNPSFSDFLREAVLDFGGCERGVIVWGLMSSGQVEVRHIRIPQMARKQVFNAVYWTVKKEFLFDEKENILDFEIQEDVTEKGIPKTSVMVYTVPRQDLRTVTDLFARSGIRLTGVTIAAFAIQNLFRAQWFPPQNKAVACLYIGNNFSRIDIYAHENLVLTRGIRTGMNSMIESIVESFNEGKGTIAIDITDEMGEHLSVPAAYSGIRTMTTEDARRLLSNLCLERTLTDKEDAVFCLNEQQVLEMLSPAVGRLARQMERTIEHYTGTPGSESVGKVFVSGTVATFKGLVDRIGQQLGMEKEILDPLAPSFALLSDVAPPDSVAERSNYNATFGLALSDISRTPNVLFTFDKKEERESVKRVNRGILTAFLGVMATLLGVFFWMGHVAAVKNAEVARLQNALAQYVPVVDPNMLLMFAGNVKKQQQLLKQKSHNTLGLAVLGELSTLTPDNIRLLSITADFGAMAAKGPKTPTQGPSPAPPPSPGQKDPTTAKGLVLDGIVKGERQMLESALARYLLKLGTSPLFVNPSVHTSTMESNSTEGEILHFTIKLGVV